jgi:hypothetical protein
MMKTLLFLPLVLLLAACPQPARGPSGAVKCDSPASADEMTDSVRDVLKKRAGSASIEVSRAEETDRVRLGGLTLARATVMIPDHPGSRCLVCAAAAWCDGQDGLAAAVASFELGAKPATLDDAQWITLVTFALGTSADDPDTLKKKVPFVPAEVMAQIRAPRVQRLASGGVAVEIFHAIGGQPFGYFGLGRTTVTVDHWNKVTTETKTLFSKG